VRTEIPVNAAHIRPLDARKDLLPVADLIEACFTGTLDPDGREYLRHIRKAATDPSALRWIPGAAERVSTPLHGYVWEEDRRVIGNISLIPLYRAGRWAYLIANVAVHPDFRRKGIARDLTLRGLDHIRLHGASSAWLQVRDDNPAAYQLYLETGFIERSRRTTWVSERAPAESPQCANMTVTSHRRPSDWALQKQWLHEIYPQEVTWNLAFDVRHFDPGWWTSLARWLNGDEQRHWVARPSAGGQPLGLASWEPSRSYADHVWMAIPEPNESNVLRALLPAIQQGLANRRRTTSINYPAGRASDAFREAGFRILHTLVWMEHPILH
jgi:predicted N-acetyltransferase YhbS